MSKLLDAVKTIESHVNDRYDEMIREYILEHLAIIRSEVERLDICHHNRAAGTCNVCDNDE